jgi:hypothetical protein
MSIDYETPKYSIREAADACGFPINTLRSLYRRGHFRIVGGEDKRGKGLAAELTLLDVICIAVAKSLYDAQVHPKLAFRAGMEFAYTSSGKDGEILDTRAPGRCYDDAFTLLICDPANELINIIKCQNALPLTDLFQNWRAAQTVVALNFVEKQVLQTLKVGGHG